MRPLRAWPCLVALAACASDPADLFTREAQSVAVDFSLLTGTSRTDLWSVGTVNIAGVPTKVVLHSRVPGRWDALTLAELHLGEGGFVQDIAVSAKNEVWISSRDQAGIHLWLVSGNGGVEDHSSELPPVAKATQELHLTDARGTLLIDASGTPTGQIYRHMDGRFEPVAGLDPSVEFTVLASRGPDDLYLAEQNVMGRKLVHVLNGTVSEIPWENHNEGSPTIAISSAGEVWFWKAFGDQTETITGKHGDGTTCTAWISKGWPVVTADQPVSHRAFGMFAAAQGKLAMLTARLDASATKSSERATVGVNYLDAEGNVTVGPSLMQCNDLEECSLAAYVVLPDGTIIISGADGMVWFTGTTSSLQ